MTVRLCCDKEKCCRHWFAVIHAHFDILFDLCRFVVCVDLGGLRQRIKFPLQEAVKLRPASDSSDSKLTIPTNRVGFGFANTRRDRRGGLLPDDPEEAIATLVDRLSVVLEMIDKHGESDGKCVKQFTVGITGSTRDVAKDTKQWKVGHVSDRWQERYRGLDFTGLVILCSICEESLPPVFQQRQRLTPYNNAPTNGMTLWAQCLEWHLHNFIHKGPLKNISATNYGMAGKFKHDAKSYFIYVAWQVQDIRIMPPAPTTKIKGIPKKKKVRARLREAVLCDRKLN